MVFVGRLLFDVGGQRERCSRRQVAEADIGKKSPFR